MHRHASQFWAKSRRVAAERHGAALLYKPVVHHLADTAALTSRFLQANPSRLRREAASQSGLSASEHVEWCALLTALHDLGKISRSFQSLVPELWPSDALGECPESITRTLRHWEATALLLNAAAVKEALSPFIGKEGLAPQLIASIAGHHGEAPRTALVTARDDEADRHPELGPACVQTAAAVCRSLSDLFPNLNELPPVAQLEAFSFGLNGLITLADWVGSDETYFPFRNPDTCLESYWPSALEGAEKALTAKGLQPARVASSMSLTGLAGHANSPRPMQSIAATLPIPSEPQVIFLEDGTGSGKTEAALLLAHRMMLAGLGEGLFVALPTMATANAMHARLSGAMPALFEGDASLVLAHGKSSVSQALERLTQAEADNTPSSATAWWFNTWIGDSRKKAFFADAGAGTIDQAFLSILPKKHLTMRQYALAGRILVVDEAHACDAYMGEELKTLLEMQARLGGSAIILSATLTQEMRRDLIQTFAKGRGIHPRDMKRLASSVRAEAYPLLTRWSLESGADEIAVEADPALSRSIAIARIGSRPEAVELALESARKGAAVAIVCNAVDSALATWRLLLEAGQYPDRCHLFHARFAVEDRLAIEEQVQTWFGRSSTAEFRSGRILVATQVIEQSLDVDFDVMISDLAPADLLVQRAGRLWRHQRQDRPLGVPVLHVLSPDPAHADQPAWLVDVLGPAAHVYRMPGVMWRSAKTLIEKGSLDTPQDLRSLIETAYAETADDLPEAIRTGHLESLGKFRGQQTLGRHNTITPSAGYMALASVSRDEEVGTRLGEDTVTLRLARRESGYLLPYCRREGAGDRLNWSLSEVSMRKNWLIRDRGRFPEPRDEAAVETARSCWPEWERSIPLYEVNADGELDITGDGRLIYDRKSGLQHS